MEAHDTTTVETKNTWHVATSDRIITGMMYFCRLLVLVVGRQTSMITVCGQQYTCYPIYARVLHAG